MRKTAPRVSVVIPAYKESEDINDLVAHLRDLDVGYECEIIVVDGDPERSTIRAIGDPSVVAVAAPKGRARQMNTGAAIARGNILLFLHADTYLPDNGFRCIEESMADPTIVAAAFSLDFDSPRISLRLLSPLATLRSRLTGVPFGDQAIFMRRHDFARIGGYRDIPILEDVDLMCRIRRASGRVQILPDRVRTSARRFDNEGVCRCLARGGILLALYHLHVSPKRYAHLYGGQRRPVQPAANPAQELSQTATESLERTIERDRAGS